MLADIMMNMCMFRSGNNLKILDFIIKFITVNMMDYFRCQNRSSQMFLHNITAKFYTMSILWDHFITLFNKSIAGKNKFSRVAISGQSPIMHTAITLCPTFVCITKIVAFLNNTFFRFAEIFKTVFVTKRLRSSVSLKFFATISALFNHKIILFSKNIYYSVLVVKKINSEITSWYKTGGSVN